MGTSFKFLSTVVSVLALSAVVALPAHAKCTRLAFSVNDYGKVEPAKDAKRLLDKYIADWMKERGIEKYRTGPKSVNCELFLDFVVFDEYTCRAEATACWTGDGAAEQTAEADAAPKEKEKVVASPAAPSKPATPSVAKDTPAAVAATSRYVTAPGDNTPAEAKTTRAIVTPVVTPSAAPAVVETSATSVATPAPGVPAAAKTASSDAPPESKGAELKGSLNGESFANRVSTREASSKIPLVD